MALNFRIHRQRKNGHLYLMLAGDFDGASAIELVRALERNVSEGDKVYIDTRGLSSVHEFGQDVFVKHCAISRLASRNLIFCGAYGDRITPKGACFISQNREVRAGGLN